MIRTWRKSTAVIGLALLAFNLIAGALLPARAASTDGPAYICTALGLKAIGKEDGQPSEAGQSAGLCAACLPLMQGGVDAPSDSVAADAQLVFARLDYLPALGPEFTTPQHHTPQSPRAPPAV